MNPEDMKPGQHVIITCGCTGYITAIHGEERSLTVNIVVTSVCFIGKRERTTGSSWNLDQYSIEKLAPEPDNPELRSLKPSFEPAQKDLFS